MGKRASIGIDIGATKTLFALFDETFDVIEEIKIKTHAERGERYFTENFIDAVTALVKTSEKKKMPIAAAGVGCACAIDSESGDIKVCSHMSFLERYPLCRRLKKMTGADVRVFNDVQAGLYGEHQLGAAKGRKHVVGVFLGTGVGGAVIIDGRLHFGAAGHAGNIGHYSLPTADFTRALKNGTLNDTASRSAIAAEAAVLALRQQAPNLLREAGTDIGKITSGDLAVAIEEGDEEIETLVRSRARLVGVALSNVVDFLNPEMIVLGGGLVEAMPDMIHQEIATGIRQNAAPETIKGLQIVVAKLGPHAVTMGAAKFALDFFILKKT